MNTKYGVFQCMTWLIDCISVNGYNLISISLNIVYFLKMYIQYNTARKGFQRYMKTD